MKIKYYKSKDGKDIFALVQRFNISKKKGDYENNFIRKYPYVVYALLGEHAEASRDYINKNCIKLTKEQAEKEQPELLNILKNRGYEI